jgi:predicted DNA-binding transcriptional regulator YafY
MALEEHAKFQRILKMVLDLAAGNGMTIQDMARQYDISVRTAYRYIQTFREVGIVVSNRDNFYQIEKLPKELKKVNELYYFTEEESFIINKAVFSVAGEGGNHQNLLNKLYALYDFEHTKIPFVKPEDTETVGKLRHGIQLKRKVLLKRYKSGNSNQIIDRLVEPFNFTTGFVSIWAYEPSSGSCKTFKISRMDDVEVLDEAWEFESAHLEDLIDVFRVGGKEKQFIKLYLDLRAYSLLVEEYPLAQQFLKRYNDKMYLFDGWVTNYEGVGRFVLGLMRDIVVLEPKGFKDFLNDKLAGKKF